MSATGLDVFDKTLQTTNTWLDEITGELGPDRHLAWHALAAVLHALRDRLPLEVAVHLGAQLPLLVRGVYYDQWHLGGDVERYRSLEEFLERIGRGLQTTRPVSTLKAAQAVFAVLARHITDGQLDKVRGALPEDIRALSDLDAPRAA
jgi:uncharacterized protein (DUF2267 family)